MLHEFDSIGYNSEGGGPVTAGEALSCDFDKRHCCWANVPPPDDQLDWQIAGGTPESVILKDVPVPNGNYLVAHASNSAPSDEAQFASCAIGCASSPIVVRARHWQSENVLLQVCQRESFPATVNFNPLLNCQEFPLVSGLGATELILPKASLVDVGFLLLLLLFAILKQVHIEIVFVASNFVGENGDIAILDDIEISYESDGDECGVDNTEVKKAGGVEENKQSSRHDKLVELNSRANQKQISIKESSAGGQPPSSAEQLSAFPGESSAPEHSAGSASGQPASGSHFSAISHSSASASASSSSSSSLSKSQIETVKSAPAEKEVLESNRVFTNHAAGLKTVVSSPAPCRAAKCTFEDGNTCHYRDALQTQSIRGLTTRFQIVTGQFMNRVTGVKEGTEGDFYAATFLFPREMAGLAADLANLTQPIRLRFQYYEGTHGVQLKGCCDSLEDCFFRSDKFVTVSDRTWKLTEFTCPPGTTQIIFVCENTRTNQGACAIDDIQVIESTTADIRSAKTLC
ncbi:unnamed protein product [Toxocara canis]|uniref:MAM domain-containing protein n=1 Tax=Toxocara canis TaxID=6265 RepID=A0A183UR07_TOXCA|nr:unnamed protein product [Toxocara canis]